VREHERLALLNKQLAALEAKSKAELRAAAPGSSKPRSCKLIDLKGVARSADRSWSARYSTGPSTIAAKLASYFGLTGTPYDSGDSRRDQASAKAGNRRARELAVELAWLWLTRHQPDSALSRCPRAVRDIKGRIRRIAIVALARKLMVALWRYLETRMVPTGAVLRPSL